MTIKIKKLDSRAIIPTFAKEGDAGRDLYTLEDTIIKAGETKIVKTGLAIQLPSDKEAQIRPRSGVSLNGCKGCLKLIYKENEITDQKDIITEEVSPYLRIIFGTCDSNYRGDIGIITYNQENYDVFIPRGTRLAQIVINKVETDEFEEVDELDGSERGISGFGSTGVR